MSAFQGLKCSASIENAFRAHVKRPFYRGVHISGVRISGVPLYIQWVVTAQVALVHVGFGFPPLI